MGDTPVIISPGRNVQKKRCFQVVASVVYIHFLKLSEITATHSGL